MKLTPKQTRFVEEYLIDLNATQAAIRAGYAKGRASEQGYQLLHKTTVQGAIATAMKVRSEETGLSAAWVLQELKSIVERSTKPGEFYNGAVTNRALELIGKHLGMFVERVDHSGEVKISAIKRTVVYPGKS